MLLKNLFKKGLFLSFLLATSIIMAQSLKKETVKGFDGKTSEYVVKFGGEEAFTGISIRKKFVDNEPVFFLEYFIDYVNQPKSSSIRNEANIRAIEYDTGSVRRKIEIDPEQVIMTNSSAALLSDDAYRESFSIQLSNEMMQEILEGTRFSYQVDTRSGARKVVTYNDKKWTKLQETLVKLYKMD